MVNAGRRLIFAVACGMAMVVARRADAVLGEGIGSVETDRKTFSARRRASVSRATYSVEEIQSDGQNVREYVSADGVVFAIAWDGLAHPDLDPLLGTYLSDYQRSSAATPRILGRRRRTVKSDRLVVEKWGHMRHLQGRAYDPNSLPAGVRVDEIK